MWGIISHFFESLFGLRRFDFYTSAILSTAVSALKLLLQREKVSGKGKWPALCLRCCYRADEKITATETFRKWTLKTSRLTKLLAFIIQTGETRPSWLKLCYAKRHAMTSLYLVSFTRLSVTPFHLRSFSPRLFVCCQIKFNKLNVIEMYVSWFFISRRRDFVRKPTSINNWV